MGVSLDAYLSALWAIASLVTLPGNALREAEHAADHEAELKAIGLNLVNVLQRAYIYFEGSPEDLAEEVVRRSMHIRTILPDATDAEIGIALGDLTLSAETQNKIGIWSGGKWLPIIPMHLGSVLLDSAGIVYILERIFYGISDNAVADARGIDFQEAFVDALKFEGFTVPKVGTVRRDDGFERDIDASVRIGDVLVIFECRTSERPLNFELGTPRTLELRQEYLRQKVDQISSLVDFIRNAPRGRNYDFTWAKSVIGFVVSPFVEWTWSRASDLWHNIDMPKILQADEAIEWLMKTEGRASLPKQGRRNFSN
jgi:hypothetical protein